MVGKDTQFMQLYNYKYSLHYFNCRCRNRQLWVSCIPSFQSVMLELSTKVACQWRLPHYQARQLLLTFLGHHSGAWWQLVIAYLEADKLMCRFSIAGRCDWIVGRTGSDLIGVQTPAAPALWTWKWHLSDAAGARTDVLWPLVALTRYRQLRYR